MSIAMATLAPELKERLKFERASAISAYDSHRNPDRLTTALRQCVDRILAAAWRDLDMPDDSALVAVGGYGRGELFPYSDVDVLILLPIAPDAAAKERLEALVQLFWDLGLEIGHSI